MTRVAVVLTAAAAALALGGCAVFKGQDTGSTSSNRETRAADQKNLGFWGDIGGLSEQEYFSPGRP